MICEFPDVQSGFRKDRGTRDQIANICWIIKKAREFQKDIYFCFIDYAKDFDYEDHNKLWKILKEIGYKTKWPASWEICMQVKKQQLESDMEQQIGSKLGKEYIKAIYCHSCLFKLYSEYIMWNTQLDEAQAGIKIARRNINILRYADAAAAATKSLQSCPTLCDHIDGIPPGSPVPGILHARVLAWVAIAFSNTQMTWPLWQKVKNKRASWWKWKRRVKKLA